ncbi:hypothetical protein MKQ70_15480 [Chitinophaga sedimenti]|uniref:hypothetical protein n=1 Tax=Chitinophaga sedimenti TaxID=2033606 RepID=UPI002003CF59|nr:hypothetical protein [Chitinophaga sedimenti]MCK7556339.1 hypothetical protein [Chitinophaga sedimenti]
MDKDTAILNILEAIQKSFPTDFWTPTSFWDADNHAVGLLHKSKLVYISNWDFRTLPPDEMRYYAEFEKIDMESQEARGTEKILKGITQTELIDEMREITFE